MPRPRIRRRIFFKPKITDFNPIGISKKDLEQSCLTFDELEAVRLVDYENKGQMDSAKKMKISQSTLSRLLKSARKKLVGAVVEGKAIRISGGNFKFVENRYSREDYCICISCGYKAVHKPGIPCSTVKCPKCGGRLRRR